MNSPHTGREPDSSNRLPFFTGVIAGFGLSFVALLVIGFPSFGMVGAQLAGEVADRSGTDASASLPRSTLEVPDDGCGVVRPETTEPALDSLTWVVTDEEGLQVPGRLANSERHLRYPASGNYDVILRASDGKRYVDVSNRVSIGCGVQRRGDGATRPASRLSPWASGRC